VGQPGSGQLRDALVGVGRAAQEPFDKTHRFSRAGHAVPFGRATPPERTLSRARGAPDTCAVFRPLIVLSCAVSLLVAAPAGAAAAKRCKQGEVRVVVDGKKLSTDPKAKGRAICIRVRTTKLTKPPAVPLDPRLERWRAGKRIRTAERYWKRLREVVAGGAATAAQARPVTTGRWRDTTRRFFHYDIPPKGVTVSERDAKTEPRAGEHGAGFEVEQRVTTKSDRGYATVRLVNGTTRFTTSCPDADGIVRGEYGDRLGYGVAERSKSFFYDAVTRLRVTAEVGPDGRVERYSYDGTLTFTVDMTVEGKRLPATTLVATLSNQGLDPRARGSMFESFMKTGRFEIRGVERAPSPALRASFVEQVTLQGMLAQEQMNQLLLDAEKPWNERWECVTVEISGAPQTVMLGGRFSVSAVARASDGAIIPDAKLTAAPGWRAGGTLTETGPGRFTLSDDGGWSTDEDGWPTLTVSATSRRGKGWASVKVRAVPVPEPTAYWTVTFEGTMYHTAHVSYSRFGDSYTSDLSVDGAFTLVWPRVRIGDELEYGDGQSSGSLHYDFRSTETEVNPPDPPTTRTATCAASGLRAGEAGFRTTRTGAPGSYGFEFAPPPLRWEITCHSSDGETSSFETRLDGFEDCEAFISASFSLSVAQLHQASTTVAVPGVTRSCTIDDGTAGYRWGGKVTIAYHAS
jgi:hypothetical protein